MDVRRRVEKLEQGQGGGGDPGEPPPIFLTWEVGDETPEMRAANRTAREWYRVHGWPEKMALAWPDGPEVLPP